MSTTKLAPEVLGNRPSLPHNRYRHAGTATSLDDVRVEHGTPTREHGVFAPTGTGITSSKLRRYGLALSRVKYPEAKKQSKRWGVSQQSLDAVSTLMATELYQRAYGDDPTDGTMSIAPLAKLLNEDTPHSSLFIEAWSYIGTKAYADLLSVVKPEIAELLKSNESTIRHYQSNNFRRMLDLNNDSDYSRRWSKRYWRRVAEVLDHYAEASARQLAEAKQQSQLVRKHERLTKAYGNGKPVETQGLTGWYPLFVSKPPLDLPHTGKLGRRNIYTNEGKYPRNIGRMITDPERRIFTRKTRSLGAVVVIDCSGSMSLTDKDLSDLMKSSAGATVLCYSTGNEANEQNPNAWVVARKGRQVRRLPDFPGGNGCDAPAMAYGVHLRSSSSQPVIWVSDGKVTGLGDVSTPELKKQCKRLIQRHGIIHVRTVKQAVAKMKQLQGGKA